MYPAAPDDVPGLIGQMISGSRDDAIMQRWGSYQRTGDMQALRDAVTLCRQAVDTLPGGDPGRAAYLDSLGSFLLTLFGRTGQVPDLEGKRLVANLSGYGSSLLLGPPARVQANSSPSRLSSS